MDSSLLRKFGLQVVNNLASNSEYNTKF